MQFLIKSHYIITNKVVIITYINDATFTRVNFFSFCSASKGRGVMLNSHKPSSRIGLSNANIRLVVPVISEFKERKKETNKLSSFVILVQICILPILYQYRLNLFIRNFQIHESGKFKYKARLGPYILFKSKSVMCF